MGVDDVELSLANFIRNPAKESPVDPWPASEPDDGHSLLEEALSERSDDIQANHRGLDAASEALDGFVDENLGAGHLHHVKHEPDADHAGR